jgi:hypothetical protein
VLLASRNAATANILFIVTSCSRLETVAPL